MIRKTILILGGGVIGWSLACLLRKQLPRDLVDIRLVEDTRRDNYVAEVARSDIHDFHHLIGLEEKTCIQNSHATFGLATSYSAGSAINYLSAEGSYGVPLNDVDFQNVYFRSLTMGNPHKFADYSLNAAAGSLGRFGHPVSDPKSVYSTIKYGLHLELNSYAEILKSHALQLGVNSVVADCTAVDLDEIHGGIKALRLSNNEVVGADLFIDCTGDASVLLGGALNVSSVVEDLSQLFNRVAVGQRTQDIDNKSISFLEANDDSIVKIIPVKGKEIVSVLFANESVDNHFLAEKIHSLGLADIQILSVAFKRKENLWVKNCIALGNAGINAYDLLVSPLTLVRNSAMRILDLLLNFEGIAASAREYNRQTLIEYGELKELIELQFYLAKENSPRLTKYFNSYVLSDSAQHRLDLFFNVGRHSQANFSILSNDEWAALFTGSGIRPKSYNLDAAAIDSKSLIGFTEKLRVSIYNAAEHMPAHADYIANVAKRKHKL